MNDGVGGDDIQEPPKQLRTKLLDLSGRNRLLNFKRSQGRSLQSVEGYLQAIYNRLIETTGRTSISCSLVSGYPLVCSN